MDAIRFRGADRRAARCAAAVLAFAGLADAAEAGTAPPLRASGPAWYADDRRDIDPPESRDPGLIQDLLRDAVGGPLERTFNPVRRIRKVGELFGRGTTVPAAADVNSVGEVPNSAWFTNRIGLFPLAPERAGVGPGPGVGPSRDGVWSVVDAKTEGDTPGFVISDARGDRYLLKFDPPAHVGMATAAEAISTRILWAAGYNVPDNNVVHFRRERLVLADAARATGEDRVRAPGVPDAAFLDSVLARVPTLPDGRYRALASRYLEGDPLGPFSWEGRRDDDPNDRIDHEHRRVLRGLRVLAAWLDHFDTKQHNTLDMFVEVDGRRFVRHHLIDLASTLGVSASEGPAERLGREYTLSLGPLARLMSFGLWHDPWRHIERPPGLHEVGLFDSEHFHPMDFQPQQPNPAFVDMSLEDGYWAAKIVAAFQDAHLEAIVEQARYRNPAAASYMVRILAERRDIIARFFFAAVTPLDWFQVEGGHDEPPVLRGVDLTVHHGHADAASLTYRWRLAACGRDGERGDWSRWQTATAPRAPLAPLPDGAAGPADRPAAAAPTDLRAGPADRPAAAAPTDRPWLAVQLARRSGGGSWSEPVTVYVDPGHRRVLALER
ncbi:MAG: hypothetical protein R6X25_09905 [Candidatus Krumholzibacteriia bacterium]